MSSGDGWSALQDCESLLSDGEELQWRHMKAIHLADSPDGPHILDLAFQDDSHQVSTSREALVTAQEAYDFHIEANDQPIVGTWAVSVADILGANCRIVDDHDCVDVGTPGHSYIDMRGVGHGDSAKQAKNARKTARTVLATRATSRGRQHP